MSRKSSVRRAKIFLGIVLSILLGIALAITLISQMINNVELNAHGKVFIERNIEAQYPQAKVKYDSNVFWVDVTAQENYEDLLNATCEDVLNMTTDPISVVVYKYDESMRLNIVGRKLCSET